MKSQLEFEVGRRVREKGSEKETNGVDLLESLLDDSDSLSEVLLGDDERRGESDDVDLRKSNQKRGREESARERGKRRVESPEWERGGSRGRT